MKKLSLLLGSAVAVLLAGCSTDGVDNEIPAPAKGETLSLEVSLASTTRAQLGDENNGKYPVLWNEGDQLSIFNGAMDDNGLIYFTSDALAADYEGKSKAVFTFQNYQVGNYPIDFVMYPAGVVDFMNSTATIPVEQKYVKGSYAKDAGVLFGATNSIQEGSVSLAHMCAYVKVTITKPAGLNITEATFKSQQEEQVAGTVAFGQDDEGFALSRRDVAELPDDGAGNKIGLTVKVTDIEWVNNTAEVVFAVVPGTYAKGFEVSYGTETKKAYSTNGITLKAGDVLDMPGVKTKADVKIEFSNVAARNADVKITIPEGTGKYTVYASSLGYNKDSNLDRFNAELPGKISDGTSSTILLDAAGFNGTLLDLYRLFMDDKTLDSSKITPDQTWIVAVNPDGNEDADFVSYGLVTLKGYTLGETTADVTFEDTTVTYTSLTVKVTGKENTSFKAYYMTEEEYEADYKGNDQKILDFINTKVRTTSTSKSISPYPVEMGKSFMVVVFASDNDTLVGKIVTHKITAPTLEYSETLELNPLDVKHTGVNYAEVEITAKSGTISSIRYAFMKRASFESNSTLKGSFDIAQEKLAIKTNFSCKHFDNANLKADGLYSIENMYGLEAEQYLFVIAFDADNKPSKMVYKLIDTKAAFKFNANLANPVVKNVYYIGGNSTGYKKELTEWTNMNTVTDVTTLNEITGMYWLDLDWTGTTAMKRMWLCNANHNNWNATYPITGTDMEADATSVIKMRAGYAASGPAPDFSGLNATTGALALADVQMWYTSEYKPLRDKTVDPYGPKTCHLVWETVDGEYGYMTVVPETFCATAIE